MKREKEQMEEFLSDTPEFASAQMGYDMRQVDAYIDKIRGENDHLTQINQQLFLLWVQELRQLAEKGGTIPEEIASDTGQLSWQKIDQLLGESYAPEKLEKLIKKMAQPGPMTMQIEEQAPVTKRQRVKSTIFATLFYAGLAMAVLLVYLFGTGDPTAPPRSIGGFSAMTVLTRSMQDDIPQHSLIITRRVDPTSIRIGDDITYLMRNNTTVTHRVVSIYPNYANTGMPGFRTQGTMNDRPDAEVVSAINLVGLVVFHSLSLGMAVAFIRTNVWFIVAISAMAIMLVTILRKYVFIKNDDVEKT